MGGAVLMGEGCENLCRRSTGPEREILGAVEWIVEAQGLPNLVHELIHALFLGCLADDHGFDYGQIPLDLRRPEHRRCLWEELACCALSTVICAPFESDPEIFAREWFAEQFEIQGVFHGLEHDLLRFRARIDAEIAQADRRAELSETVDRGRRLLRAALAGVGRVELLEEFPPGGALELWRRYRASTTGSA